MIKIDVAAASDMALVELTRSGISVAYGELWRRHSAAVIVAARNFTGFDPDDVAQEAFFRVLQQIRSGRGPETAFRAYLIMTARNVATNMARGRSGSEVTGVEDDVFDEYAPATPSIEGRVVGNMFTRQVFSSLPTRWQEVLWYRDVEGLPIREMCTYLGITENATSVLVKRAREGFKQAWIAANLEPSAGLSQECQWVIEKLPQFARGKASARTERKLASHFDTCPRCATLSEESGRLHERLALVLLPPLFGGSTFAGYSAWLQAGSAAPASAAQFDAVAAMVATQKGLPSNASGIGGGAVTKSVIGSLAVLSAGTLAASIALSMNPAPYPVPEAVLAGGAPPATADVPEDDEEAPKGGGATETPLPPPPGDRVSVRTGGDHGGGLAAPKSTSRDGGLNTSPNVAAGGVIASPPAVAAAASPAAPVELSAAPADGPETGVYPNLVGVAEPRATVWLTLVNQRGQTAGHTVTADAHGRWAYTPTGLMGQVTVTGYQEYSRSGATQRSADVTIGQYEVGFGLDIQVDYAGEQQTTIRVRGLSVPTKNQVVNIESTSVGILASRAAPTAPGEFSLTVPYARSALGDLHFWQGDSSEGPRRTWWRML